MAFNKDKCLKFICVDSSVTISVGTSKVDGSHYRFSKDGVNWVNDTITLQPDEFAYCAGTNYLSVGQYVLTTFAMTGDGFVDIDGNIMSLVDDGAGEALTITQAWGFWNGFLNCTQIRNILNPLFLPATTLTPYCYDALFAGCSNIDLPKEFTLPARNLPAYCYCNMFAHSGVTKIYRKFFGQVGMWDVGSYGCLFYECQKLKYIEYPHYMLLPSDTMTNWVYGVPAGGEFYALAPIVERPVFHPYYVPVGWTVKYLEEFNPDKCLKITCLTGSFRIELYPSATGNYPFYFSKDGETWVNQGIDLTAGEFTFVKGTQVPSADSGQNYRTFQILNASGDATFSATGRITSLLDGGAGMEPSLRLPNWSFGGLFLNNKQLVSIDEDLLPADMTAPGLYYRFFEGTGLTELPPLLLKVKPKDNVYDVWGSTYQQMFANCKGITRVPPKFLYNIRSWSINSMAGMFMNCSNLNEVYVYFKNWDTSAELATANWLYGVSPTGTFHCPDELPRIGGPSYIPASWLQKDNFDPEMCLKFTMALGSTDLKMEPSQLDPNTHYYFSKTGEPDSWVADEIGLREGEFAYVRGKTSPKGAKFSHGDGHCEIVLSGNVMSLVDYGEGKLTEITEPAAFKELFKGMEFISKIADDLLPATKLSEECYRGLFSGAFELKDISEKFKLPAVELPKLCYAEMFYHNLLLTEAPKNLFPNPVVLGYENFYKMFELSNIKKVSEEFFPKVKGKGKEFLYPFCDLFQSCGYLEEIHFPYAFWEERVGPGGKLVPMTSGWVTNVKDTGIFYRSPALIIKYDDSHIPTNWQVIPPAPSHRSTTFLNKVKMGGYK